MEQLKAATKWLASFFKSQWTLDDYPVRFTEQATADSNTPRWSAQIINWWGLTGLGETRAEAYENLSQSLRAAHESRGHLPRPGTKVAIEFASADELEKYWGVASRIISEVLGFDPEGIFVSDGSSLWDFAGDEGIASYQEQIKVLFGKDVSHIDSGNLAQIAKFIADDT